MNQPVNEKPAQNQSKTAAGRSTRLRLLGALGVFMILLLLTGWLLAQLFYRRLDQAAFLQAQSKAAAVAAQLHKYLEERLEVERRRPFTDYFFSMPANTGQADPPDVRSPLAALSPANAMFGLIGYFQLDVGGQFGSPLLPGLPVPEGAAVFSEEEIDQRAALWRKLETIVSDALSPRVAETCPPQAETIAANTQLQLTIPAAATLIFSRCIWSGTDPFVQGFAVSRREFFDALLQPLLAAKELPADWNIQVLEDRLVLYANHPQAQGFILYQGQLMPAGQLGLVISAATLPAPAAAESRLVTGLFAALAVSLLLGGAGIYSLGAQHLKLAQQRTDFTAAITHELKSPLTAIRMHVEMLRAGMVSDEKQRTHAYELIFRECERLSHLIEDVLTFTHLNHDAQAPQPVPCRASDLITETIETFRPQAESHGFVLTPSPAEADHEQYQIETDRERFVRIMASLLDNAFKFASSAARKEIEIGYRIDRLNDGEAAVCFFVRDFGPGVPPAEQDLIFQPFYRAENERTRATPGTGIGLALVVELCRSLELEVRIVNREPGAEFQIWGGSAI